MIKLQIGCAMSAVGRNALENMDLPLAELLAGCLMGTGSSQDAYGRHGASRSRAMYERRTPPRKAPNRFARDALRGSKSLFYKALRPLLGSGGTASLSKGISKEPSSASLVIGSEAPGTALLDGCLIERDVTR